MKRIELRECISRISSKNAGQAFSAQKIATELGIPLHEAYERIRRAVRQKLIRRANPPQKGNRKLYLPTVAGIQFLPNPEQIFKSVVRVGKRLRFVHPITGESVIFKG